MTNTDKMLKENMMAAKTAKTRRVASGKSGDLQKAIFAENFRSALDSWISEDSSRSEKLFADLIGLDPRNLANWKSKGLQPTTPKADEPLAVASGYLGIRISSWWGEPEHVQRAKLPSSVDIEMVQILLRHAQRRAIASEAFREALRELVKKDH